MSGVFAQPNAAGREGILEDSHVAVVVAGKVDVADTIGLGGILDGVAGHIRSDALLAARSPGGAGIEAVRFLDLCNQVVGDSV